MWPFSRRPKFQLPPWTFRPVDDDHLKLSLSLGRWLATDGAYLTSDSVEMGQVTAHDGFLDLVRTPDGLKCLTLAYQTQPAAIQETGKTLTIDSGDMVLCCEEAFRRSGITMTDHRTSYLVHRAAHRACPRKKVVLIHDADQHCIGIIAAPMWGDGSYRLEFRAEGEFR